MRAQSGVALITALLVVAIATVAAVSMIWRQQIEFRRTQNLLRSDQAELHALGVEAWARGVLSRRPANNAQGPKIDSLSDAWAKALPPTNIPGGQISGRVEDMQARFNINNLYLEPNADLGARTRRQYALAYFRRLLRTLRLDEHVVPAIIDWMDADNQLTSPDGAEDYEYLGTTPSYRVANGRMTSITELRLVKGITEPIYEELAPYLCALPRATTINVNTASAPVLESLAVGIDPARVEALLVQRARKPFANADEVAQTLGFAGQRRASPNRNANDSVPTTDMAQFFALIGVSSQYYMVRADARVGRARQRWYTLLEEQPNGQIYVWARTQGTF